jgi:AhpD family alkylhydroperoxidase
MTANLPPPAVRPSVAMGGRLLGRVRARLCSVAPVPDVPTPEEFRRSRGTGNERLRAQEPVVESFFAADGAAYEAGALPAATKELLGLVLSVAKDCEECVYYHLERCEQEGVTRAQVLEALQVSLVGAGSVVVPLLRRAAAFMSQLPGLAEREATTEHRPPP